MHSKTTILAVVLISFLAVSAFAAGKAAPTASKKVPKKGHPGPGDDQEAGSRGSGERF